MCAKIYVYIVFIGGDCQFVPTIPDYMIYNIAAVCMLKMP